MRRSIGRNSCRATLKTVAVSKPCPVTDEFPTRRKPAFRAASVATTGRSPPKRVERRRRADVNLVFRQRRRGSDAFLKIYLMKNLWSFPSGGEHRHSAIERRDDDATIGGYWRRIVIAERVQPLLLICWLASPGLVARDHATILNQINVPTVVERRGYIRKT